ncbi:GDSL esterase/lipase At1g71691-like [Phalaenopsis equestris]|uniref:GDSL esterase/lipase At1g71691-like n=1 Tax=Phalaenopsis equestris TaxID=78828 RepID=UPI0009E4264B|nr:GDSL esterase/lipase At1g71691-like [Phalaenopsis equestris]
MATFSSTLFLLHISSCFLLSCCSPDISPDNDGGGGGGRKGLVPALFIFGDSLIDNGNNNNLASLAKANYYPYGIDFADGPTGRFSNGYTIVDEIASLLGLPLIPAYSEASGKGLLHGVNYASAAAGILDDTGRNFLARIPFNEQIKNFESTLNQISTNLSVDAVGQSIADSILYIGMGSNDYLNNYLMPNYDTRSRYNPTQFSDLLIQHYYHQLTSLYNLGARKFVLAGLGSLGCVPNILALNMLLQCSEEIDKSLILPFNRKMKLMVDRLNYNFPSARFTYIDNYHMFMDIINNPETYGFHVINSGCCGIGRNNGQLTCLPYETPCPNREQYVFWDAFHPTEKTNVIMAKKAFRGGDDVVYPINIEQLVNLKLI